MDYSPTVQTVSLLLTAYLYDSALVALLLVTPVVDSCDACPVQPSLTIRSERSHTELAHPQCTSQNLEDQTYCYVRLLLIKIVRGIY